MRKRTRKQLEDTTTATSQSRSAIKPATNNILHQTINNPTVEKQNKKQVIQLLAIKLLSQLHGDFGYWLRT